MRSSLDYAGFAQLCGRSPIMREIMREHNRIIPRSLLALFLLTCQHGPITAKTRYRPGGGETICPRRWQFDPKNRGGSTSVRGRVRSPHISGGRLWLSCRQPACYSLGSCAIEQTDGRTDGSRYLIMSP